MTKIGKRFLAVYREATDIVCPLIPGGLIECGSPQRVTANSPLPLRRAVFRLAQFFRREFSYDFVQYGYEGKESDPKHAAFLWLHPESNHLVGADDFVLPAIGACCFRWREYTDHQAGWALQWIWVHPYFRRRGLLSEAWNEFREEFGDFLVEPPVSQAMTEFLALQKECWKCGRTCVCERTIKTNGRKSDNANFTQN